ncbi:hypothetical protein GCM10027059_13670 [Myceligenerans halotolerans]
MNRLRTALALALLVTLAPTPAPAVADDQDPLQLTVTVPDAGTPGGDGQTDPGELTNAQLRWGVSTQAGSESHLPGQCAFLVAGRPGGDGDTGGSRVWTDADRGLYRSVVGDVRVMRPVGTGASREEVRATFDTRCTAPDGQSVSYASGRTSQAEVVLSGGTGRREADGAVRIRWEGTFTVVFYGGLVHWWVTDPELRLDADGSGSLVATLGGYGTDREDATQWVRLEETRTQLVTFTGRELDPSSRGGSLVPDYCGVVAGSPDQLREDPPGSCWGAFPAGFLSFHRQVGDAAFWYSTGTRDEIKPPANVTVSFDATRPVESAGPAPGVAGDGAATGGPVPGGMFAPPGTTPLSGPSGGAADPAASPAADPADGADRGVVPLAAATLGGLRDALLPEALVPRGDEGQRLAILTTILLLTASVAVVGFRQGWLKLPFRRRERPEP